MELALIPPVAHLADTNDLAYQLVLPHMLIHNKEYAKHYMTQGQDDKLLILDNGAAEGEQVSLSALMHLAKAYNVSEFALPDIMGEGYNNMQSALESLRFLAAEEWDFCSVGFVAHGDNVRQIMGYIDKVLRADVLNLVEVIYLPRILVNEHAFTIRTELCKAIKENYAVDVHLFGASQNFPGDILCASRLSEARSVDTSVAYTYAAAGELMGPTWVRDRIIRRDDYFDHELVGEERVLMERNIQLLKEWCYGTEAPPR